MSDNKIGECPIEKTACAVNPARTQHQFFAEDCLQTDPYFQR